MVLHQLRQCKEENGTGFGRIALDEANVAPLQPNVRILQQRILDFLQRP